MYKITPKQRLWISWILDNKDTFLKGKVDAKSNHIALNWTYVNGDYDVSTKVLLNYILKEFNKDEEAKRQWKMYSVVKEFRTRHPLYSQPTYSQSGN